VRKNITSARSTLLVLAAATLLTGPAFAFLPVGGFDSFGTLRFRKFPLAEFDTNNNGTVEPNEGLEIVMEVGPRGFTPDEVAEVRRAMQTWEDVPTSYASFGTITESQDVVQADNTTPDFLTTITMQVGELSALGENQEPDAVDDITDGLLGIVTTLYTLDETIIDVRGVATIVPAGTILDSDLIVNAFSHRVLEGQEIAAFDLQASVTHGLGRLLGLGINPLNNLRQVELGEDIELVSLIESEPLGLTGGDGIQRRVGATPTMFPAYFQVEDFESGEFLGGWADLAPDDISGISWLYPRTGLEARYFTIEQEARTTRRTGSNLPSFPLSGGHVVAWADADDDPATPRIPLFNTMTGLFVPAQNPQLWGQFELIGMWKQMEVPGTQGVPFEPSYTLTLNPFNGTGLTRQAPPSAAGEASATSFDSISGTNALLTIVSGTIESKEYDESFISEVFNETQNVTDISNKDAGTPLVWDFARNQVISEDTERTIPTMLPNNQPMFGDPNDICPLNVISGTGGTGGTDGGTTVPPLTKRSDDDDGLVFGTIGSGGSGPGALRWLRDTVLLNTALGSMIVDAYYTYAPYSARFLLRHHDAIAPARWAAAALYWVIANPLTTLLAALALAAGIRIAGRRKARATGAALLALAALTLATSAGAQIRTVSDEEMVAKADLIVEGTVTNAVSAWGTGGRIFTTVTMRVDDHVKLPEPQEDEGEGEEGGIIVNPPETPEIGETMTFRILGGQIGSIVMEASPLPRFKTGDAVLAFFVINRDKFVLFNGERGKLDVLTTKDGEKFVVATSPYAEEGLAQSLKAFEKTGKSKEDVYEPRLPIDFYKNYLQGLLQGGGE